MSRARIGVLALQGAVPEHLRTLTAIGAEAVPVKWPEHLEGLDGLILPGGESTTISDLMQHFGLWEPVKTFAQNGGALYGTCAGMILLATDLLGGKAGQKTLDVIPMKVQRNGFGRQVDSCEVPLAVPALGPEPLWTVFIRAPYVVEVGAGVEVMARHGEKIVLVRHDRHLASAFHPELTEDRRIHRLFVQMALEARQTKGE